MNAQEFAPDNNSASKLNKSQIIGGFLFKTDQQFTKTIEKRVCDFNDPTAGPEVWVAFQFPLFLAAGTNMRRIASREHLLTAASIASIQTQILRVIFIRFWTQHHNMIQGFFQQFDIVCIGSGKNNCQRKSLFIRQHTAFCPHFFLDPLDSFQRLPEPAVLSPCSRPDFAIPSRSLPAHHIFPDLCTIFFQKILLLPIPENIDGCCWLLRILWVLLSIGSPFVIHRIFPLIPVVWAMVFFRRRVYAYKLCPPLAAVGVSHPLWPPRTHLILSMICSPFSPFFPPPLVAIIPQLLISG